MRDWIPRVLALTLLAAVMAAPLALRPAKDGGALASAGDAPKLVILTPHNDQIRHEFEAAFNAHRKASGQPAVIFDWRAGQGAADLRKQVIAELEQAIKAQGEQAGLQYDLFFGGGDYDHGKLADGVKITLPERGPDGKELTKTIPASAPLDLPDELFKRVFPNPTLGGEPTHHPKRLWLGVAWSSFGIVYNHDALKSLGLKPPSNWPDLADERYLGQVALADPAHSGSIGQTYNIVLRRLGWTRGWATLRRVFANARDFSFSSSQPPVDVAAGQAAAGMCIDFYGRYEVGAVPAGRIGYVDPVEDVVGPDGAAHKLAMTAITADPVSLLRGAPHKELAVEFATWLLSEPAQRLWQLKRGAPGGPDKFELRRMPLRPDVYAGPRGDWTDPQVDPYAIASPLPPGTPNYFNFVAPLTHAMAADIHDDLKRAWRRIVREKDPTRKAELEAMFDAMPEPLILRWRDPELAAKWRSIQADPKHARHAEVLKALADFSKGLAERWKDESRKQADRLEWTLFFRDQYRRVAREP